MGFNQQNGGFNGFYPLVMTNIANWNIPTINGGIAMENHLFRLGSSIPWLC